MAFELHENLKSKIFVIELPLCKVLLEDNAFFPWLFLVPRRPALRMLIDVPFSDQPQLWKELEWAHKVILSEYKPIQINVAALGNITPQLHLHIIARFSDDPMWPQPIWSHSVKNPYTSLQKERTIAALKKSFEDFL